MKSTEIDKFRFARIVDLSLSNYYYYYYYYYVSRARNNLPPLLSLFQKLEETVAENARLEQDLVVLRQKLQASRRYAGNVSRDTSATTGPLEAELRRVQQLVGDLQRQRKELSIQVRQLTEKSHNLVQQIRPQPTSGEPMRELLELSVARPEIKR